MAQNNGKTPVEPPAKLLARPFVKLPNGARFRVDLIDGVSATKSRIFLLKTGGDLLAVVDCENDDEAKQAVLEIGQILDARNE